MYKLISIRQLILSIIIVLYVSACTATNFKKIQLEGKTMGTTYHVTYITSEFGSTQQDLQAKIDAALKEVNQVASTYIEDSELSLFNANHSTALRNSSEALRLMFTEAIRLAEFTDGYLDVTVGPLVNLWGFGPTNRPEKVPTEQMIEQAKKGIGAHQLVVDDQNIGKTNPNLYVDLSTIAKGYGVDVVANVLQLQGVKNYVVEIGGEIRVSGQSLNNKDWTIAVEKPTIGVRAVERIFKPKNNAVATSGDYRIYFEEDNVRYSHLIDPKTGRPITHQMVSATVIHPSCMVADGLSTGFMVMGIEKAMALANQHEIPALFITKTPQGDFVEQYSNSFKPFLL